MMTRTLLARCAPLAIAASVALPAIPAIAQDAAVADPVIVLPPVEAAPAAPTPVPAPTVVLPEPAPVVAAPVEQVEETVAETTAAPAQNAPVRVNRTTAAPASQSVAVVAAPTTTEAATAPATVAPVATPANAEIAPPAVEPVAMATDNSTNEALIAGLLGALGIVAVGGVAMLAARHRRRHSDEIDAMNYQPVEETYVEKSTVSAPVSVSASPAFTTPVVPATSFAAAAPATATAPISRNAPTQRAHGDPVALPAEVPQTFEERDALLKELVAAEPDRANPFTGVRARARRAKLIMQSLGQDFHSRKPRIDLSEYTNRWPALRGWQPATA